VLRGQNQISASYRREFFVLVCISWLITGVTAGISTVYIMMTGFKIVFVLLPYNIIPAFLSLAVFLVYAFFRNDFFILSVSNGIGAISVFMVAGAIYSYAAMHLSSAFSLWDSTLAQADRFFGLDWLVFLRWMDEHFEISRVLNLAYTSIFHQAVAVIIVLSVLGKYRRLQIFILAGQIAGLSCSTIAAFVPAVGAYTYFNINIELFPWLSSSATSYVADVLQLRSGSPTIPLEELKGVITFPSFHAVLCVLYIWAFWQPRIIRFIAIGINLTMIVATPMGGGHYFVDIAAGVLLALGSIVIANRVICVVQRCVLGLAPPGGDAGITQTT
jgi:hypothetical protein